ncbi:MAG TPA: class I SAM-dependent methyltransferase [Phycisphaerae bacterium]|nr:class I SAM-dependent methyltransferase [Phycisphaerae bacterium]HPS53008.1 class I SAM-dependent methyltransferase [Phycisphaerae bacterium]
MNDKIDKIRNHYLPRIKSCRKNYDVLDWAAGETQLLRFSILADNVPLNGLTLLDVGCGLGDLAQYLAVRKIALCRYAGVDVLPEMLLRARQDKPELELFAADIFAMSAHAALSFLKADKPFDVVYCSGAFNLNLGNNESFMQNAVEKMAALASKWLVFNCLHARHKIKDDRYYAYQPTAAMAAVRAACGDAEIHILDKYLENDFTVICRIPDFQP